MSKSMWRKLGVGAGLLLAAVLLAGAAVYAISERALHRTYDVPLADIAVPTDSESLEKGRRLATIYGCFNSCHGRIMEGAELYDEPGIAKINAPNLTRVLREYSNPELERLIRHGVKRDGTSTWIMPAPMFSQLSDEDLGAVIAFVRSAPVLDGPMRETTLRPLGRIGIAMGKFRPLASLVDPQLRHAVATDRSDPLKYGKYLVMTTCTECHGANLQGSDIVKAPGLAVTAGYSDEDFRRLMRTGIAIGGRNVGMMTEVGATRFPSLTDEEVEAMLRYLKALYKG
jgi:cytochrome c553